MKKQAQNRYQGTRFQAVPKHQGTHPFAPGNVVTAPEETTKMPAYHGSGRQEYVRKLPPLRDRKDIDLAILANVIHDIIPEFDSSKLSIINNIAAIGKLRFRYSNLIDLLWILRSEKKIDCSTFMINAIDHRYNSKFQQTKAIKR